MTGYTHLMTGIVMSDGLKLNAQDTILCMFATLLPDIDKKCSILGRFNPLAKYIKHRGITHHPLIILVISVLLSKYHLETPFFFGALSHLFLDSLTPMGIPLWNKHRLHLAYIPTGSMGEWTVFLIISLLPILWR